MVSKALCVTLEAKPGKESQVAEFLLGGLAIVRQEPGTTAWFAIRFSATKFGIRGLTRSAAIELGKFGIRVNNVIPGPTKTKMT